jgi:hypothetical protein
MATGLAHAKILLEAWAEAERRLARTCRNEDDAHSTTSRVGY